tara:strand:+ start:634 stop:747 length:114 start_codon:yes stop_codon:yes gene_type:complete
LYEKYSEDFNMGTPFYLQGMLFLTITLKRDFNEIQIK